ncbi:hypothetical protein F2P81_007662 [Scophthalmus maximus]|uniref:Uncharacterized protein n=1 Tax=Scophthalmus maximus TaxID=52904 RepID=A0A6A4T094_SCOMX|nr:hypothetical protein F2P81_007662 [Scophthalmus maximus]
MSSDLLDLSIPIDFLHRRGHVVLLQIQNAVYVGVLPVGSSTVFRPEKLLLLYIRAGYLHYLLWAKLQVFSRQEDLHVLDFFGPDFCLSSSLPWYGGTVSSRNGQQMDIVDTVPLLLTLGNLESEFGRQTGFVSDGAVQFRQASRYQLLGRETDGDIALTILNAQWSDHGVYGCRAEIPGWFNDYKVNTHLVMEEGCVSAEGIITTVGADVTLLCNYDAKYYGRLPVCWGRGAIPNSGCANEVIKADGTSVISRQSERYVLMGDFGKGDVSLTIRQLEESDSGIYGCRVDIPGWFNDHKHQLTLTVVAVRPNPLKVEIREVKERTVTVRWTPVFDGGRPITSYSVDLKNKQASWDTAERTELSNPELTQVTLMDLRPAKTYNLRMFVANSVGMSEASNVLTLTAKEAAPEGPPLDMQLEAFTSHSIKVTWKPPRADLRNGVLRSYSISYRGYDPAGKQFKKWQHQTVTATRELESVILSNLKPSTKYGVLIQAKTNAGAGPASTAPFCSTLDEVPPDPPVVGLKEVIDNSISLFWTPGFEGDSPITGYYLEYKAVNASWDYTKAVVDFSPNQTEATIIETNPSTYNIRMFAKNSLGNSKPSNVLTITTGRTAPQREDLVTPVSATTASADTHAAAVAKGSHNGHLVGIVMPVVLVVLIVAIAATWQLRPQFSAVCPPGPTAWPPWLFMCESAIFVVLRGDVRGLLTSSTPAQNCFEVNLKIHLTLHREQTEKCFLEEKTKSFDADFFPLKEP